MSTNKIILLFAIWVICAAGGSSTAAMVMHEAAHPLSRIDPSKVWFVVNTPLIIVALAGVGSLPRVRAMLLVTGSAFLIVALTTLARYQDMQANLSLLDARAAGQHGMDCGPPIAVLKWLVTYSIAFVVGMTTLIFFSIHVVRYFIDFVDPNRYRQRQVKE